MTSSSSTLPSQLLTDGEVFAEVAAELEAEFPTLEALYMQDVEGNVQEGRL